MIVYLALALGALIGAWQARRAKGGWLDIAQYAAVYCILFGILGMILTVLLDRML